ncbi:unnamed protein product [Owenia fusiformis]|uniref:Uncharacterized protein n=1 Tax=Owenia fusiformis TaxID=6347 RepID=A0A8J1UJN5_OWEFU|nr:unnamed protein product [Owenia fusiformis]
MKTRHHDYGAWVVDKEGRRKVRQSTGSIPSRINQSESSAESGYGEFSSDSQEDEFLAPLPVATPSNSRQARRRLQLQGAATAPAKQQRRRRTIATTSNTTSSQNTSITSQSDNTIRESQQRFNQLTQGEEIQVENVQTQETLTQTPTKDGNILGRVLESVGIRSATRKLYTPSANIQELLADSDFDSRPKTDYTYSSSVSYRRLTPPSSDYLSPNMSRRGLRSSRGETISSSSIISISRTDSDIAASLSRDVTSSTTRSSSRHTRSRSRGRTTESDSLSRTEKNNTPTTRRTSSRNLSYIDSVDYDQRSAYSSQSRTSKAVTSDTSLSNLYGLDNTDGEFSDTESSTYRGSSSSRSTSQSSRSNYGVSWWRRVWLFMVTIVTTVTMTTGNIVSGAILGVAHGAKYITGTLGSSTSTIASASQSGTSTIFHTITHLLRSLIQRFTTIFYLIALYGDAFIIKVHHSIAGIFQNICSVYETGRNWFMFQCYVLFSMFVTMVTGVCQFVFNCLNAVTNGGFSAIMAIFSTLYDSVISLFTFITSAVVSGASSISGFIVSFFTGLFSACSSFVAMVFISLANFVYNVVGGTFSGFRSGVSLIGNGIEWFVTNGLISIGNVLSYVGIGIVSLVSSVVSAIATVLHTVTFGGVSGVKNGILTIGNGFSNIATKMFTSGSTFVSKVCTAWGECCSYVVYGAIDFISWVFRSVGYGLTYLVYGAAGLVSSVFRSVGNGLSYLVLGGAAGMKSGVEATGTGLRSGVGSIAGAIGTTSSSLVSTTYNILKTILEYIFTGIFLILYSIFALIRKMFQYVVYIFTQGCHSVGLFADYTVETSKSAVSTVTSVTSEGAKLVAESATHAAGSVTSGAQNMATLAADTVHSGTESVIQSAASAGGAITTGAAAVTGTASSAAKSVRKRTKTAAGAVKSGAKSAIGVAESGAIGALGVVSTSSSGLAGGIQSIVRRIGTWFYKVITTVTTWDVWLLYRSRERRRGCCLCLLPLLLLIPLLGGAYYSTNSEESWLAGGILDSISTSEQTDKSQDSITITPPVIPVGAQGVDAKLLDAKLSQITVNLNQRIEQIIAARSSEQPKGLSAIEIEALVKEIVRTEWSVLAGGLAAGMASEEKKAAETQGAAFAGQDAKIAALQSELQGVIGKAEGLSAELAAAVAAMKIQGEEDRTTNSGNILKLEASLAGLKADIARLQAEQATQGALLAAVKDCCKNETFLGATVKDHIAAYLAGMMGGAAAGSGTGGSGSSSSAFTSWLHSNFVSKDDVDKRLAALAAMVTERVIERQNAEKAGGAVYVSTHNNNTSLTQNDVKLIIAEALAIYGADRTGMVDYALESAGGSILSTRCSETYQRRTAQISMFGIPLWYNSNSPRTVIQPDVHPGQCWAFKGDKGYLVIQLSGVIKPSSFSLEHIPKSLSPNGHIDSAPQNFTVWGLKHEKDIDGLLLGNYTYDDNGPSLQNFPVEVQDPDGYLFVELKIESNWGNEEYTCIYRFRVHGDLESWY